MILFLQISGWVMFGLIAVATIPTVVASLFHYLKPLSRADGGEYRGNEQIATPLVSVIMPARNEGAQIEQAMQSILASSGITLELIVVNDRSTDQTGAIINRLASADQRVHPIHITELPPGWLGKNHAMHVASEQARGTLLLFTDGDILFHPDAIQTAIQDLRSSEIQHLTILPQMLPGSIGERASIAFFGLAFLIGVQLPLLRTRFPMAYAGVGAFNLIDADFYRRMGGHKALRLNVLDDMYLGKHVKQAGGIHNLKFGPDLLAVRWQPSWWGIITGLEKNGFAALGYSIPRVLMATVTYLATMVAPYPAAILLPWPARAGFLATILLWHLLYASTAIRSNAGWWLFPLFPVGAATMAFAFWRSTWITLRNGGVRWRDSFYPLPELRAALRDSGPVTSSGSSHP